MGGGGRPAGERVDAPSSSSSTTTTTTTTTTRLRNAPPQATRSAPKPTPSDRSRAATSTTTNVSVSTASSSARSPFNPREHAALSRAPADARELFDFIDRYRPRDVDPPADLKPFVPDFQPAVGDIDEFVKIPRPDGVADELGLRVLDEPKATQSDPDVLRLKLRRVRYTGSHTTPSAW